MYEISRLVLPTSGFCSFSDLFVRKEENCCEMAGALANVNVYKFNTWMNLFAPKKHYFYCDLGEIYLKLDIEGSYKLQVIGSNRNAAFGRLDDILVDTDCSGSCCVKVPNARHYEAIYYAIFEDKANPIRINSGAWCTDIKSQRENKLAVVICTFKREDYAYKNIEIFEQFISLNPELAERLELIVVDNGKTLDSGKNSDKVRIIPNMNAGGAGGFTRGLMEVIEQDAGFTRAIFMDDDVEIFPESFARTLAMSDYLKDEYKKAFINGAMLDLYDKRKFYENLAIQQDLWVRAHHCPRVLDYNSILEVNDIPNETFHHENEKTDSAWWYHCFDLALVHEKGLPAPVFFRGDDVEWSWRHFGLPHISINGISVWHTPFEWRVSKLADYYYLPRNMFMLNTIYTNGFKNKFMKFFKDRLNYLLQTYDYVSLELLMRAFNDILRGSDAFRENPEEQFRAINEINKKTPWVPCESVDEMLWAQHKPRKREKLRKFIYKRTNFGINCWFKPFFRKRDISFGSYPCTSHFMLRREVKVYNFLTEKYEPRKFDRKKLAFFQKEGNRLIADIFDNYDKLKADYTNAHQEFTTLDFWKKYLEV